eukprot:m.247699 g.247699  ORF g.247699 m.247699 type:complete len:60 (-) comp16128_c0_seq27:4-183(-)
MASPSDKNPDDMNSSLENLFPCIRIPPIMTGISLQDLNTTYEDAVCVKRIELTANLDWV